MGALIVLADDDPDLRGIYAAVLRSDGHEVFEACDGAEAVNRVRECRPALLLLDVWMPGVNGFEVLDLLRDDPSTSFTRVVMLSNLGDADTRLEGFSGGVVDYWVKGLSLDEFCARVRQVLGSAAVVPDPI